VVVWADREGTFDSRARFACLACTVHEKLAMPGEPIRLARPSKESAQKSCQHKPLDC